MADNKEKQSLDSVAEDNQLGLAGRMTRSFIHSPLTPMLIVLFLLMGLAGIAFTPRQEDPQISVPMVDIFVKYPGASAKQVSALVLKPLERIMSEMSGVKHVYGMAQRDSAMVTVQFFVGQDMERSLTKLYSKLNSNKDLMPPGVTNYMVKPKSVDDVPGLDLTLWSNQVDDATLRLVALDVLQKLSEVPNTNEGFVVSGRREQLRVEILPEKLAGYGITLQQIAHTIVQSNNEKSVGNIEAWDKSFKVYTGAFLKSKQDVESLVVGVKNGIPVYMRDVANVIEGPSEVNSSVKMYTGAAAKKGEVADGAAAVTIAIAKKKGSNVVSVNNALLKKLDELKGVIIPANVHVYVSRNYGVTANDKVNELIFKLFFTTGLVTLLVWFALGWRPAFVVMVVIPIVLSFSVFSAMILNMTIDRVSLFALVFAIGILVDDAIVVMENIYRHWRLHDSTTEEVTIRAVDEVGNPTILATFTVVAALLPMGFVRGMMGPYMIGIPILGSVAMVFSLFAAFAFTPWLANKIKPTKAELDKAADKEHRFNARIGGFFRRTLSPLIDNRLLGYGFLILLFVGFFASCAMFYTNATKVKLLPLDNQSTFDVVINFPEGTGLIKTANLTERLVEKMRHHKDVVALQSYIGTVSPYDFNGLVRHYYLRSKPWQADIAVELLDKHDRELTSHEIAGLMRKQLTPIAKAAGARIAVVEMPPGPPVLQSVVAIIYGPDTNTRHQFANDMTTMFEKAPSINDVDNLMHAPYEIWRFEVDRDKALRDGISIDQINNAMAMAMGGYVVGDLKRGSVVDPTYIILQVPLSARSEFSRLGIIPVSAPDGTKVPLSELGTFVKGFEQDVIYQKDLRNVEFVTGGSGGVLAAPIYGMFQVGDMLDKYTSPDGHKVKHGFFTSGFFGPPENSKQSAIKWGGAWTVTYETFRDMGSAFMIAIVLIYMLVVVEFKNYIFPSIIMAPIPLTLVGIIPGHWLLGADFTATSMIGWIALSGIIVRNSILLVDFTRHEVARGVDVRDAVINACQARTRPIVITALALVGDSLVIITDPIFQGMAASLLFGVIVSTVLTLFIIPLGCITAKKAYPAACVVGGNDIPVVEATEPEYKTPLWMRLYSIVFAIVSWLFVIGKMLFNLLRLVISMFGPKDSPPPAPPAPVTEPPVSPPTPPAPESPVAPTVPPTSTEDNREAKTDTDADTDAKVDTVVKKPQDKPEVTTKSVAAKTTVTKKVATKKIAPVPEKPAPKKKTVPEKKVSTKKTVVKTTAAKSEEVEKEVKKPVIKKVATKKVQRKKISASDRRGIRLKIEDKPSTDDKNNGE